MASPLHSKILLPLLALPLLGMSCTAKASTEPAPGGLEQISGFLGEWSGTQDVAGSEESQAATYAVVREGDTMIWSFHSGFGGGFDGKAVTRWDDGMGHFVETWTDNMSPEPMESHGQWDAATHTMTATSRGPSFEDPEKMVDYRYLTTLDGGHFDFTMVELDPAGPEREVMWIHMDRKE